MATRLVRREVNIKIPTDYIRTLPDPNGLGRRKIIAQVPARVLYEANINFGPNPRKQNTNTKIAKGIRETLTQDPQWFSTLNKGVFLIARDMNYNNKTQTLSLTFMVNHEDPWESPHGNLDGGHTNRIINDLYASGEAECFQDIREEPYVTVEITQLPDRFQDRISDVVGARNSVVAVDDLSIIVCGDEVDWLRDLLKNVGVSDKVSWKQFDDAELSGSDLIAIISMLNEEVAERHHCYSSPSRIISALKSRLENHGRPTQMMVGLKRHANQAIDYLKFYDYVHKNFESWYIKSKGGDPSKFGALSGVNTRHRTDLVFLGENIRYEVNKGWLMPFVGAFAGEITNNEGYDSWCALADKVGPRLVSMLVNATADERCKVNVASKKRSLWESLHDYVSLEYYKCKLNNIQR